MKRVEYRKIKTNKVAVSLRLNPEIYEEINGIRERGETLTRAIERLLSNEGKKEREIVLKKINSRRGNSDKKIAEIFDAALQDFAHFLAGGYYFQECKNPEDEEEKRKREQKLGMFGTMFNDYLGVLDDSIIELNKKYNVSKKATDEVYNRQQEQNTIINTNIKNGFDYLYNENKNLRNRLTKVEDQNNVILDLLVTIAEDKFKGTFKKSDKLDKLEKAKKLLGK